MSGSEPFIPSLHSIEDKPEAWFTMAEWVAEQGEPTRTGLGEGTCVLGEITLHLTWDGMWMDEPCGCRVDLWKSEPDWYMDGQKGRVSKISLTMGIRAGEKERMA